jgi:hypothetical protein
MRFTALNGAVTGNQLEAGRALTKLRWVTKRYPLKDFHSIPEIIRLAVMLYVRYLLSLLEVTGLLLERSIAISQETVRFWWSRTH